METKSIKVIAGQIQELKARAKKAGEGTDETSITEVREFDVDHFCEDITTQIKAEKEIEKLKAEIGVIRNRKKFGEIL